MKLVVTGASGYIGQRLSSFARRSGHVIVAATRNPPQDASVAWLPFDLLDGGHLDLPAGTNAVFHLAVNTAASTEEEEAREIQAAVTLIEATARIGAKLIFVSSQTARADAPTVYGRTKWQIEQKVLASGGCVIRPGQVYGGAGRGLFGTLLSVVRASPFLPAFLPAPMVQPIHVDDLVAGLMLVAEREVSSRVLCLAAPEPVSFSRFIAAIAKWRLCRRRFFLPVPVVMIKLMARLVGESKSRSLGLARLGSLFDLPLMQTAADVGHLGITLRPLEDGMHRSGDGRRRRLLQEGNALLQYVLKEPPSHALLRRYVRAVERLRGTASLHLTSVFIRFPILLALLEGKTMHAGIWEEEFIWRLDAATALAEATPQGARRFLAVDQGGGFLKSTMWMCKAVFGELFWRLAGVLCYPFLVWLRRKRTT